MEYIPSEKQKMLGADLAAHITRERGGDTIAVGNNIARVLAIVWKHDPELAWDFTDTLKDYLINRKKRKRPLDDDNNDDGAKDEEEGGDNGAAAIKKSKAEERRGRPSSVKLFPIVQEFAADNENFAKNPRLVTVMRGLLAKYQTGPLDDTNKFKGQLQTAYNILAHIKDGNYSDDKYDDVSKDTWASYDTYKVTIAAKAGKNRR